MSIKTLSLIALGIVLAGLVSIRLGLFSRQPSDQVLIEQAMQDALKAAKDGRSGPVLDFISKKLQVNSEELFDRGQIAEFVRNSHPEVIVENNKANVTGDSAVIVSPVRAKIELTPGQVIEHVFNDVKIEFKREDSVTWLVFPSKKWRILKVESSAIDSFPSMR